MRRVNGGGGGGGVRSEASCVGKSYRGLYKFNSARLNKSRGRVGEDGGSKRTKSRAEKGRRSLIKDGVETPE